MGTINYLTTHNSVAAALGCPLQHVPLQPVLYCIVLYCAVLHITLLQPSDVPYNMFLFTLGFFLPLSIILATSGTVFARYSF